MKIGRAIISALLIFSVSGCSSVKVIGQPFYPDGQFSELTTFLDQGVNKITKKDIQEKISGKPEITVNEGSEKWFYQISETRNRLKIRFLNSSRQETNSVKELTLNFNKTGVLTSYQIKDQSGQTVERNDYAYQLSNSIILGVISGVVFSLVNTAIESIKTKK